MAQTEALTKNIPPLWLAPMDGVTDFPFRLWLHLLFPPDCATTPFLRVTPGLNWKKSHPLFIPECFELKGIFATTVIPQLMGSDAEDLAHVAETLLDRCESVDINCGCPAPIVFKHGAGSAMITSPERFEQFLNELDIHIGHEKTSIKMRTGIASHDEFPPLLSALARFGPRRLFVHPRTRKQGYTGDSDWSRIAYATQNFAGEIVGSGDIVDNGSCHRKQQEAPRVAGLMIGRGALANPWIFSNLKSFETKIPSQNGVTWAIALLLLCHHVYMAEPPELVFRFSEILKEIGPCDTNEERLESAFRRLASVISPNLPKDTGQIALSHHALPRTKQLVKFLQSDLIDPERRIKLLRSESVDDFLSLLLSK